MRYRCLILSLLACVAPASGCQIAQQAVDLVASSNPGNHLESKEINPLSAITSAPGKTVQTHQGEVLALRSVSGGEPRLLSLGQDRKIVLWDLPSGQGRLIREISQDPRVATFGESKSLIAWADDTGIYIECLQGCSGSLALKRLKSRPAALAFHDGDTSLLIGGLDGRVYRWRFMKEQEVSSTEDREKMIERYIAHHSVVSSIIPHPAGRAFFSADWEGSMVAWLAYSSDAFEGAFDKNVFKGRFYTDIPNALASARTPDRGICALAISKNGERIAVGTEDGHVETWEVRGFTMSSRKQIHKGRVMALDISADGNRVVSVGKDTKVKVSELSSDPSYPLNPTALPKLLNDVSENPIPSAALAVFVSPSQVIATTKEGALAEIRVQGTPIPEPTKLPAPSKPTDLDY
jgi:WD40 repeat protein